MPFYGDRPCDGRTCLSHCLRPTTHAQRQQGPSWLQRFPPAACPSCPPPVALAHLTSGRDRHLPGEPPEAHEPMSSDTHLKGHNAAEQLRLSFLVHGIALPKILHLCILLLCMLHQPAKHRARRQSVQSSHPYSMGLSSDVTGRKHEERERRLGGPRSLPNATG